jgi:uncharacterized protein YyaL (SSP411 family)
MRYSRAWLGAFLAAGFACAAYADERDVAHAATEDARIVWLRDDGAAFTQAKTDHRFVLLYLEAVWCHWCHVMDEKTYGDAMVAAEVHAHYVPLRIDQDLRPDLSNRYKDYGWPATVIFGPGGNEIAKRQGYVPADEFADLLRAIVKDPSPEAAARAVPRHVAPIGELTPATRAELVRRHRAFYDAALGGLTTSQKFLDRDSVEYALAAGERGDKDEAAMARKTLDAARALFDPAWGGVYQYSTNADWQHPHYEKLATVQAQYLRIYALAHAASKSAGDRDAALSIRRYLDMFLKNADGAFYVSQDADLKPGEHSADYFALDDAARRAKGLPHVDTHVYALQNGQIIEALATWAEAGGDADALAEARRAADWAIEHRALPGGGFRHDEHDAAGPYLGDTLAMGRAFLALYRASAERAWLAHARAAADFIEKNFRAADGGYVSAQSSGPIASLPQIEENIALARFANLLARNTGDAHERAMAQHAMRYLADPAVALGSLTEPGVLLADDEIASEPLHLTVVGSKSDPRATELFAGVKRVFGIYKRAEWWDRDEGALPNPDVNYPPIARPAAFVCTDRRCSLPIFAADRIAEFLVADAPAASR